MTGGAPGAGHGAAPAAASYSAPALEKGLDVLELLAGSAGPLTQSGIAAAQGRSVGQLFRVLLTLERRGYAVRTEEGGYVLSERLFDLAHRQAPRRGLLAAAAGPMRRLAEEIGQSCNLGVREGDVVRVLAQAESPSPFGFSVRVGAAFPLVDTVTGAVLRAFTSDASGQELDEIRRSGRGERSDSLHAGVTDVVVPVLGPDGAAVAALTVPYVSTSYSGVGIDAVRSAVERAAEEIGTALGRSAP
ncbi:IclR family transcriptional regulator [Naasia aerilata]|uniref:Transcriptional regulator n=1 Tax=Naasia aerilata TaxID=1162966 RepID=A0ABM8GC83_9MICO|nr:IclR family transcriptional regulator [Naasia aerilata]BDZ45853.1 transcriptional regulator [Naasia aerilata]